MAGHRVGHRRFHKRVSSRGSNGSTDTSPREKNSVSVAELPAKTSSKKEKTARGARAAPVVPQTSIADGADQRTPVVSADATPDAATFIPDGSDQRPASRIFISSLAPVLEHLCEMTADRGPTSFDGVKPPPIVP